MRVAPQSGRDLLQGFWIDEEGASLVEYSILASLVTAATVSVMATVGENIWLTWEQVFLDWYFAGTRDYSEQ